MKFFRSALVTFIALLVLSSFLQENKKAKRAPTVVSPFSGAWSGGEKCLGVSAPTAILNIRQHSTGEVIVNGIYSTQADVKVQIKGSTLDIPMQEVKDPQFVNFFIGGKLTLSDNRKSLKGNFVVRNNNLPDTCEAVYFVRK